MRQYELAIRIAQIHHLVDERKYKKALAVIQTLDMRQVKSLSDLKVFAEVYTRTEQFDAAKATYLRIYRKSRTRRVLHRLIYLSIRTNALEDADAYYQEYVRMHPSERDALILRYRIEKAKGVPIGELIQILQDLKQEEYIEEWAYELAKLYHRAGRREECMRECEDILLWFGSGEIVERAKILMEHLKEKDPIPYMDDKDFTMPKREEPNPDDTGSLPDIKEFIKEQKEQKKEERRRERELRREERFEDAYEDDYDDDYEYEAERNSTDVEEQETVSAEKEKAAKKTDIETKETFEKREEKKEAEISASEKSKQQEKKERSGIYKLSSSILKFVMKEEEDYLDFDDEEDEEEEIISKEKKKKEEKKKDTVTNTQQENSKEKKETPKPEKYEKPSQSGTGITQDLAKEIAAIYEMEHKEQLKEKAVTVIKESQNMASDVLDRMTKAAQKTVKKTYIPLDVEEIQNEKEESTEVDNTNIIAEEAVSEVTESVVTKNSKEPELDSKESAVAQDESFRTPLEGYSAMESRVIENEYVSIPEIDASELPTTRALHRSFKDILTLISGELDPSHFVLMGEGDDRIVGVAKQIIKVMKETGFLSVGRIAKISSEQLNKMDLIQFRSQLKGNCLLIDGAADLLFPTISKIFSIMEEYQGDFVVILADEGATLDQLFRFVPALAQKFKYIIDISEYSKEDYEL